MLPLLLDCVHHPPCEIVPVDDALIRCDQRNAGLIEGIKPVPGFQRVEETKANLIPDDDIIPPRLSSVGNHPLELHLLLFHITADTLIDVPVSDLVSVLLGIRLDCVPLLLRRFPLFVLRHAYVGMREDDLRVTGDRIWEVVMYHPFW